MSKQRNQSDQDIISLFSGAMGLDLGLEKCGFRVRVTVEINKAAVETIHKNRKNLPVIEKSIAKTETKEILKKAGLKRGEALLISAGPCCQSFSTAGKRLSVSDPRGNLFVDFCRIVEEARPRFFVMENVKGLLSAAIKHRPLDERGPGFPPLTKKERLGSALELIRKKLSKLGYYVVFGLLNAADYGVPQRRWRVIFIGSRDGEDIRLPKPTHFSPDKLNSAREKKSNKKRWVTLRQALKDVDSENWIDFTPERLKLMKKLNAGENWRDLPKRFERAALGAAADSWGGRVGFCRRLTWNEPAPTLTTAPEGRATTLCHPFKDRPLSVEEYIALQQFPKDWKLSGSKRQQYLQLGNAVPVGLGSAVGRAIKATMVRTKKYGLPKGAKKRRGQVTCTDTELAERLKNRKITQLHPRHLRKIKSIEKARQWLAASA